ncbi:MAG TPA: hypothetical protein VJ761_03275 [Ktedonobacteraceae bacterium]|nr:hypothetical protein [Ktedonobacteraceae bacterium]
MPIHHRKRATHRRIPPLTLKIGLALLGVILLSDIVALHFFTQIETTLTLPTTHAGATFPAGSATPTRSLTLDQQGTLAQDTFLRANQNSWGIATDGQRWQADAGSSPSFAIANRMGRVANGNGIYDAILGPRISDAEIAFTGSMSRFGQSTLGAVLRWTDVNNLYKAFLNGSQLILLKDVAGNVTILKSVAFPAQAGASYTFQFRVLGASLAARAWLANAPQPANWQVAATDTSLSSGYGGIRVVLQNGITAQITSFTESKL